jgi:hypothetical protein
LKWIPAIAPTFAFLGWMFVFGRVSDALDDTPWVLAGFHQLGIVGIIFAILSGYGIGILLALLAGLWLPRYVWRRHLRHFLYSPACFWCGYSLKRLQVIERTIRCPECGQSSPVAGPDKGAP